MLGFNGGRLGSLNAPALTSARGIWTPNEQYIARTAGNWPLATDPYWSDVSLLLHFNAPNGSTVFTDSSNNAFAATRSGNTVISTAQSKYGGSSAFFDGSSDALIFSDSAAFQMGTGDFTVESWIYFNATTDTIFTSHQSTSGITTAIKFEHFSNGWQIRTSNGSLLFSSGVRSTAGVWQHIAFSRNSGQMRAFLDGVQIGGTTPFTGSYILAPSGLRLGSAVGGSGTLNGYLDDYRITKGVGRYTTNFVPLSYQFPDS